MIKVLSVDNMRKSDAFTIANYTPSKELMFRAGKGVFESVDWKPPVAIMCGSGNNAGDGYVLAKLLKDSNINCEIILLSERFSEDGEYYFNICKEVNIPIIIWDSAVDLSGFATIVDCIFGTGFKGTVRGNARDLIEAINASNAYVVSVDINSGLNGDNGIAELCVRSDLTVSIGGFKSGHFLNMAKDVMKNKVNCEIGIDPVDKTYYLIQSNDIKGIFKPRKNFSNKGSFGYVALIGGSKKYPGAIQLAEMANAAMRSGAGVVKIAAPNVIYPVIASKVLESTLYPLSDNGEEVIFDEKEIAELISNVKTVAFGMGIGTSDEALKILEFLLSCFSGKLIVDADGLTLLSRISKERIKNAACTLILTPHIKEFSRLTGKDVDDILNEPVAVAEDYAKQNHVVLLLKGPSTIITDGDGTYFVDTGCAGMATAGSGDVLSGILSAVLAYSQDVLLGTAASAYINGKAGELAQGSVGSVSMVSSDTVSFIQKVVSVLEGVKQSE